MNILQSKLPSFDRITPEIISDAVIELITDNTSNPLGTYKFYWDVITELQKHAKQIDMNRPAYIRKKELEDRIKRGQNKCMEDGCNNETQGILCDDHFLDSIL